MKPWFVWDNPAILYILIIFFILTRLPFARRINKKHCVLLILCFILYTVVDVPHINDAKRFVEYIFRHFICTSLVILLLSEEKASLVKIFINFYAGVLLFSTIIYVLVILGMPIYSYQVSINDPYYSWGFSNSLFLILPITSFPFPRFQSIFLEPGHLGMISSLMLYMIRYNMRSWQGIIIFLSSLLSMSLAAYMLLFLGMVIYKLSFGNLLKTITFLLMILMTCTMAYNFFPNSYFSQAILLRLEYDEDKGFKGNNRISEDFEYYYNNKFYKTEHVLLGIGGDNISTISGEGGNSSYKVFIVQYGILGLVVLSVFFFVIVWYSKSSFVRGLLLLYVASFWQRPYALWEVELFLFISIALLAKQNEEYNLFAKKNILIS
ncbi:MULTISPECIES: hypothetical protein [Bacteroides]|jgi:hypothetical protein|nr:MULTISPECIES: hypothetical protein [Bacteroides]MCB6979639.1 hypothetical protein [Bacteroides uniformis]MCB7025852.1 hypothetical protein [Bacteroides uniformis]MDC1863552.1 hypothetical protein [Bacteroides uniformis]MDC1868031.1 hypothetical protein [Bacteroides uniformis]MDC1877433.1 hypothetical protein [Bacteroides uniformis]